MRFGFAKIYQNATAPWLHGKLYTAGTNPIDTSPGTNSDVKIVIPSDKIGAFISRQATGSGTFSSRKVRLTLDYGTAGISNTDTVQVKVFGIEMAYIPEGPFYIGDGDVALRGETTIGAPTEADVFTSTFNSSGTFQWAKRLGGTRVDYGTGVAVGSNNDVVVTGFFVPFW